MMLAQPKIRTNFAAKAMGKKNRLYKLTYAPDEHINIYYFLLVNPTKEQFFLKALRGVNPFNIRDYGEIVTSGYGEPAESLKQMLRDKYNADIE